MHPSRKISKSLLKVLLRGARVVVQPNQPKLTVTYVCFVLGITLMTLMNLALKQGTGSSASVASPVLFAYVLFLLPFAFLLISSAFQLPSLLSLPTFSFFPLQLQQLSFSSQ